VTGWNDPVPSPEGSFLRRRDGVLAVEGCDVQALAERFGTPLYVLSETALRRRVAELRGAFGAAWPEGEVLVMPAVKANFGIAVQRVVAQEGCGADLFGAGELEVAVRAGIEPDRISLNGPSKDFATIHRAVSMGARITLDDVHEIELVRRAAKQAGRRAIVRVRVRPQLLADDISDVYGIPVREAYARYKPGIPWEDLVSAHAQLTAPELDLAGVMMHFGRHTTDLRVLGHVARRYALLIGELARAWDGWTPRTIDIGGGLAARGDPYGRARDSRTVFDDPPGLAEYAAVICANLRDGLTETGIDPGGRRLEVEPGRALFGPCGIHLTRVLNIKRQHSPFPYTWVETDTSQAFLPDIVLEDARYPIAPARLPADDHPTDQADVVGRSCTSDVLAQGEVLPAVAPGSLLAFCHTGAYQEAGATNFNALSRPAAVMVNGSDAHLIRRAETIDDVLARDIIPAHLTGERQ
jgi:diaminopimelate decarboxylase